ncbi:AmmeMemoRadiSam system protein B [bacterium]|nr:AmmeMemoRadiSam system protein B [bacterium]MBU1958232.1 AmmeMemoRadiSam system protein B [bacterium]
MPHPLRMASVKGTFYPSNCNEIKSYFKIFNREFEQHSIPEEIRSILPRAILVPHAGYIYSGFTANFAYRFLNNAKPKRIIVIGPSHYHAFEGVSGSFYEAFESPCGNITIDTPYLFALAQKFNIGFQEKAHLKEHSTEVQMPFIQHYFPKISIIELLYGEIKSQQLVSIIVALLHNKDNVVILSSDLSHFYPINKANELDKVCLSALSKLDEVALHKGCKACGFSGIEAMILASKELKLNSKLLDYRTSAEVSGDKKSVVGYLSAMFY